MKRTDLLKKILAAGCELAEGGRHTLVLKNGNLITTIPRHKEINELTAKGILKKLQQA